MSYGSEESGRDWTDTTAMATPALLGAAAGLLLGEVMHRSARRVAAISLAALALAAIAPWAVGGIVNKVNGPQSSRGARRRLQGIRDAGVGNYTDVEEELREQGLL